jgi:hypothetical protein
MVRVFCGQCMRVVSGVRHQKFRRVVDNHVINSTLHWTKEMLVKMWDMDGLVDHLVIYLADWVIISKASANSGIGLSAKKGVITLDNNRSVIVKED